MFAIFRMGEHHGVVTIGNWLKSTPDLEVKDGYARTYSNGLVLVNASVSPRTVNLGRTYYLAQLSGGGTELSDGVLPSTWTVIYSAVSQVTLEPGRAAILLLTLPPTE